MFSRLRFAVVLQMCFNAISSLSAGLTRQTRVEVESILLSMGFSQPQINSVFLRRPRGKLILHDCLTVLFTEPAAVELEDASEGQAPQGDGDATITAIRLVIKTVKKMLFRQKTIQLDKMERKRRRDEEFDQMLDRWLQDIWARVRRTEDFFLDVSPQHFCFHVTYHHNAQSC